MAKPSLFCLDTCVLINDPKSFEAFPDSEVIIPITVLDELDHLKTQSNVAGKNARAAIRNLDEICSQGEISKGIKLPNGTILSVDTSAYSLQEFQTEANVPEMDNRILACALNAKKNKKKFEVVLVSEDINMRVRGQAFGLKVQGYSKKDRTTEDLYSGLVEIVDEDAGFILNETNWIDVKDFKWIGDLSPNQCVHLSDETGRGLCLGQKVGNKIKKISPVKVWGLEAKSKEQSCAMSLLMNNKIPLVSLVGKAGTGKSTLAIAAALELILEKKQFQKLVLYKPLEIVGGKDIGYLPGDKMDKLAGPYSSFYDSFEFLFSNGRRGGNWMDTLDSFMERGVIQMEPITYLRGKNFGVPTIIIADEFQNTDIATAKTLLTRSGINTRVFMMGDYNQIDGKNDNENNALLNIINKFKNEELAAHISLTKGERSPLADLSANLL